MDHSLHSARSSCALQIVVSVPSNPISVEISVADAFRVLAEPLIPQVDQRVGELCSDAGAESLHKLRVALRRLRSLWWAYKPYVGKKEVRTYQRELKILADAAGRTRDWDILYRVLTDIEPMKHSFTSLLEGVRERRCDAFMSNSTTLESADAYPLIQERVGCAFERLQAQGVTESLPEFARRRVNDAGKSMEKKFQRVVAHQTPDYSELHGLRISGKKLRYLLEFFLPVLDDYDPVNVSVLTGLQDELGKLNDLVGSESLLLKHVSQLGDPGDVNRATHVVNEQKIRHMQNVYELLHTVDTMLSRQRS